MKLHGIPEDGLRRIAMAFLAEPDLPSGEQFSGVGSHPGFHTTENFDVAATYAVSRVAQSFTETAEDGTHYVTDYPVVVSLDMAGYQPQPDYDAEKVVLGGLTDQINYFVQDQGLSPESSDEEINDALQDLADAGDYDTDEPPGDWLGEMWKFTHGHHRDPLVSLWLADEDMAIQGVRYYMQTGQISEDVLMAATDQYRYTEDVSEIRLRAVWYVVPVATDLSDWQAEESDYFEGDPREQMELSWPGFELFDRDDFYSFSMSFSSEQVWEDPDPQLDEDVADQLPLFSPEQLPREPVIQYHGTTLSRLLQASPGLEGQLPVPPSPPYRGGVA